MAYSINAKDHFKVKLWTGTGSENAITGIGFQPDFTWIKNRAASENHKLYDAVRGVTKNIYSNLSNAEGTDAQSLKSFDSDGFTLGTEAALNANGQNIVAWNWKANGAGSANTDGSINSTATSANTTAGISIIKYTGTGSNATVGHGLGSVPAMIMVKNLGGTDSWMVYHKNLHATAPEDYILQLNTNGIAVDNATIWNDTAPTSSVFSIGTDAGVNGSSATYIAYAFAEKTGFSKFGSYTGNDVVNGPFIYCGFKPSLFLVKMVTSGSEEWSIYDNKRLGYNPAHSRLYPNTTSGESAETKLDFLSNGIKIKSAGDGHLNQSAKQYVYMAFAEAPLVGSNNIPATAR